VYGGGNVASMPYLASLENKIMQTILKIGTWLTFIVATIAGAIGTLYTLYVFVVASFAFGLMFGLYLGVPLIFDAFLLYMVMKRILDEKWRLDIYKPQVWLPVLVGLPIFVWLNYQYMLSLRGI
jgi:hypothetical protein